jgi:hypothetical protein
LTLEGRVILIYAGTYFPLNMLNIAPPVAGKSGITPPAHELICGESSMTFSIFAPP